MAGLSLSLLLVVGVLTWVAARPDTYLAPRPDTVQVAVQPALAARALHQLERAVRAGDAAAAAGLAPAGEGETARLLSSVVENAESLAVRDFTLRYVEESGATDSPGAWRASVEATWRFAGFDRAPARTEILIGFVSQGDRVALGSLGGGDRRTPLWLTGPLQIRRTDQALVLVAGSAAEADRYASRADDAVPVVRRVLASWRPRLVVEVPASAGALDQALGADPGEYANIAAVTTSVDGSLAPDAPVHVFVNPAVFGRLKPVGAQVVMSHEATHVATDATRSAMPLWLVEGFADYVALRDVDLPLTTTAGQIIGQVRREGPPRALPGVAEFDTSTSHLGAAYESAWLVCRVLVEHGGLAGGGARGDGQASLVRLYRMVEDGTDLGRALRQSFGLTTRGLTRAWAQRLSGLAA